MSQLNSGPREAGEAIRADVLKPKVDGAESTTCKRHAERVRICFAQDLGKAGRDPLERRDRRCTEADNAERECAVLDTEQQPWSAMEASSVKIELNQEEQVDCQRGQVRASERQPSRRLRDDERKGSGGHRSHFTRF